MLINRLNLSDVYEIDQRKEMPHRQIKPIRPIGKE